MGKIKPFYLFFVTYMGQGTLVLFQLPQIVAAHFGYNSWLVIPIISLFVSLNIGLIFAVYRLGDGASIFSIIENGIPKAISVPLYIFLSFFWGSFAIVIMKKYFFVASFLYFPYININWFLLVTILLVIYLVTSGIVPIVHTITILFFLSAPTVLLFLYFIPDLSFLQLTNFYFDAGGHWKSGILDVYAAFLGFEIVLFLFPYLEKSTKGFKYALYGHFYSTFVYTAFTVISLTFNSLQQLKFQKYPVINLLQYIELEFIERIDSLIFLLLFINVISTVSLYLWIGVETLQRVLQWNIKAIAITLSGAGYLMTLPLVTKFEIDQWLFSLTFIQMIISISLPCMLILLIFCRR